MARDYRAEYQRREAARQDEARALGITLTARQAAGHTKAGQISASDVKNLYTIDRQTGRKAEAHAVAGLHKHYGPGPGGKGSRRKDVPADVKRVLGPDWDRVIYGGYRA